MKAKRKMVYLNRTIVVVMLLGYSAFLILLLIMDWTLIRNYQFDKEQAEMNILTEYVDELKVAMNSISSQFYNLSAFDNDYAALSRSQDSVQEYKHAYELHLKIENRMLVEETMSSYFIFYHNREQSWYRFRNPVIDLDYVTEIKANLMRALKTDMRDGKWFTLTNLGIPSLVLPYSQGMVDIAALLELNDTENILKKKLGKNTQVIFTEDGKALNQPELSEKLKIEEFINSFTDKISVPRKNHQVYGCRIPKTNLWIYAVCPAHGFGMLTWGQIFLLILTMLSVAAVVLLGLFIRKQMVMPLRQLTATMNGIRNGESTEVPLLNTRFYEFQEVNDTLGQMVKELEERKLQVYEENIEKQKAQIQYLQLQLKPHFYLNGLKTLNVLALDGQTDKMQDLIMNLSKHLRYFLQSERDVVPLESEVEFVENYVNMQKHVTGRPVNCSIYKEPGTENWNVPVLCLQTFVENSIKYARLGDSSVTLEIDISIVLLNTEEGEFLDLCVQDNGQGYPEEILDEINGDPLVGTRCVGINNIKRRCMFLYGDKAEYLFMNMGGALSELIIPKRRNENEYIISRRSESGCR